MRLTFFVTLIFISTVLIGQGVLEFEKTTHDFGQIKEVDGAAEYSFEFVNSGDQPLKITYVKASCGCTTPFWTRDEIAPGDSGRIDVKYSTRNRPGAFSKTLRVSSNSTVPNITLIIKGHVEPKPRTIEDDLPSKYGAMRIKYRSFNIGNITTEKAVTREFDVYNDSDSTFSFLDEGMMMPEYISFEFAPQSLGPKEKGIIKITYDPTLTGDLGYQTNQIKLLTTESSDNEKKLAVIATVEEYFPPMTEEELDNAPKLSLSKKSHDFGKVAKNSVLETVFVISNSGKSDLNIRSTKSNCGCTVSALEKDTLQPGDRVEMKVTFQTKGRRGKQFKNVTIFSNDPVKPTQMVTIKAEVGN